MLYVEYYWPNGQLSHHDYAFSEDYARRMADGRSFRTCPAEWVPDLAWLHKDEPAGIAYLQ